MLNIGSTSTGGKVVAVTGDSAQVVLTAPVCTKEGEKIALSRRVENHWRCVRAGGGERGRRAAPASGGGEPRPRSAVRVCLCNPPPPPRLRSPRRLIGWGRIAKGVKLELHSHR